MTEFQKIQMQNPVITEMCKMAAEIALTGSSKQIAWAEDLRRRFVIDTIYMAASKHDILIYRAYLPWLCNEHTDARWWIDNRNFFRKTCHDTMGEFGRWCQEANPELWAKLIDPSVEE